MLAIISPRGTVVPDKDAHPSAEEGGEEGGETVTDALRWIRSRPTVVVLLTETWLTRAVSDYRRSAWNSPVSTALG